MDIQENLIVILAFVVGALYLYKLRELDLYEKEPIHVLLGVMLFGGIISISSSLLVYQFFEVKQNFVDAIIKIGLIEELSKLFALVVVFRFIKKDFNEIVDGLVYITAISLGFAVIENIFYSVGSDDPFGILATRSFYAVLGHMSFSGYMGIAFYIHKKVHKNYLGLIVSIVTATLAHGFYDGFIFHQEIQTFFHYVFLALIFLQYKLFKSILGFSSFRKTFEEVKFEKTNKMAFLSCVQCDSSLKVHELSFHNIRAGKCHTCENIVLNSENTARLFRYFRPSLNYSRYTKDLTKLDRVIPLSENRNIFFHGKRLFLSANTQHLHDWFEEENHIDRQAILHWPIIGPILGQMGLKYLD